MTHTPRISRHALERCRQMGISTKRAKRVVQHRTLAFHTASHNNYGTMCMSEDPDIVVVWDETANMIVTVLPRTQERYSRPHAG